MTQLQMKAQLQIITLGQPRLPYSSLFFRFKSYVCDDSSVLIRLFLLYPVYFCMLHKFSFKLQFSSILSITVYQMHSAKAAVRTRFSNDKLSQLLFILSLSHQLLFLSLRRNALARKGSTCSLNRQLCHYIGEAPDQQNWEYQ